MSEFESEVTLDVSLQERQLRQIRNQIENAAGDVQVGFEEAAIADGGSGGSGREARRRRQMFRLARERTESLASVVELLEQIEDDGAGGGGGALLGGAAAGRALAGGAGSAASGGLSTAALLAGAIGVGAAGRQSAPDRLVQASDAAANPVATAVELTAGDLIDSPVSADAIIDRILGGENGDGGGDGGGDSNRPLGDGASVLTGDDSNLLDLDAFSSTDDRPRATSPQGDEITLENQPVFNITLEGEKPTRGTRALGGGSSVLTGGGETGRDLREEMTNIAEEVAEEMADNLRDEIANATRGPGGSGL